MDVVNTPVEHYSSLDLSLDGPLARDLLSSAEHEAALQRIVLSDHISSVPSNMTPAMAAWYATVAGPRNAALDQIGAVLDRTDDEQDMHGIFLERAIGRIQDSRLVRKRETMRQHREKNQALYERLVDTQKSYLQSRRRYAELVTRHGREAKLTPKWYWPFLLVIGLAEVLVNFEAFNAVPFFTPAIATGSTLAVAAGLAYSSDLHGRFLRQYHSRFGPQARDGDRAAALRIFGLGSLCLSVVLAAVAYARNSYFADILLENRALGTAAPSWLAIVGGSMIMNLVVWIVGVIGAFVGHDEDHLFPDSLMEKDRAEKRYRSLQATLSKPLERKFEKIDADIEIEIEQAKNKARSFAHLPAHAIGRQLFGAVKAQDGKVLAILETYRGRLIKAIASKSVVFEKQSELATDEVEQMTPQDYAAQAIELKYV
jgi:hypothetical protein